MAKQRIPPPQRFMRFVEPEPMSGCWLWTGGLARGGYGAFPLHGQTSVAHRASYIMFVGAIPPGLYVLHNCDNPACVNPDHLRVGTQQENIGEMAEKRRGQRGSGSQPFGVYYRAERKRRPFFASVRFQMKRFHLGSYATAEEASNVAVEFKERCYREGVQK